MEVWNIIFNVCDININTYFQFCKSCSYVILDYKLLVPQIKIFANHYKLNTYWRFYFIFDRPKKTLYKKYKVPINIPHTPAVNDVFETITCLN